MLESKRKHGTEVPKLEVARVEIRPGRDDKEIGRGLRKYADGPNPW